jgi:hypothetical protein
MTTRKMLVAAMIPLGIGAAVLMGQDRDTANERRPPAGAPWEDRRGATDAGPRPLSSGNDDGGAMAPDVEAYRAYLKLVEDTQRIAESPTASGVAAVFGAGEIVNARGTEETIQYFERLLPNVKDPAVARAIRLQLADAYKQARQPDRALEQFDRLITAQPER